VEVARESQYSLEEAVSMAVTSSSAGAQPGVWSAAPYLSPRGRRLRDEYFSFYSRDYFRNEVRAFGSGVSWDEVWSPYHWGVAPEIYVFMDAYRDSLLAAARPVSLPAGFWSEPLVVRRARFFREVIEKHLAVQILDGELIVGSYFNTALSKTHTRQEARRWKSRTARWLKKARWLNELGIGNCGAIPGHLIPNYPKVLRLGFSGIVAELEEKLSAVKDQRHRDFLRALVVACEAARPFAQRYAAEAARLAAA